jgi:chromosome segregation ATPase
LALLEKLKIQMKRITLHTLVASLILSMGVVAYAETGETAKPQNTRAIPPQVQALRKEVETKRNEIKEVRSAATSTIKEKRDEIKDMREDMREERASTTRERVGENVQRKAENIFTKMNTKFEATIEREESIMAKLSTRIDKIKTAGGNTTEAEKLIADAKTHFDAARTSLATLKTDTEAVTAQTATDLKKEELKKLKADADDVQKHLREGHSALEKSLGSLKGLSQMKTATSTKTN